MAKFELRFKSSFSEKDYIKAEHDCNGMDEYIFISGKYGYDQFYISLDKSTAIKFAKTLRTEINKIQEGGSNG